MDRLTKEQFFKEAPEHLVEAVKSGKSAYFGGELYTLGNLGVTVEPEDAVNSAVELTQARARIAELEAELATKGDVSLYECFLPTSKSEIGAQSLANLKSLATIRGVKVDGEDKAAYVSALSPAEEK